MQMWYWFNFLLILKTFFWQQTPIAMKFWFIATTVSHRIPCFLCSVGFLILPGSTAICRFPRQSRHWPGPSCWAAQSMGTTSAGRTERGGWKRLLSAGWRLYRPPCPMAQSTLRQERERERSGQECSDLSHFFKHQYVSSPKLGN